MEDRALIDHLAKEMGIFKELIEALQAETESLTARDYRALYDTVSRKEHLLLRLDMAGSERLRILKSAAGAGKAAEPTLSAVIDRAEGREKVELKACQETILSLIETVRELNRVNSLVVKGSLENIKKTLGLLGSFMPKTTYKPTGAFEGINLKGARLSEGA